MLSDGAMALFIADDHTYDSILSHLKGLWSEGDTLADAAQDRIKGILKDHGGALESEVCEEDSLKDRMDTLKKEGLTAGTLALVRGADEWVTYMGDALSEGFFDGYSVSLVKRGSDGFVEEISLAEISSSTISIAGESGYKGVSESSTNQSWQFITLVQPSNFSVQKSPPPPLIDLEKYIGILDRIRGVDDKFSACTQ